MPRTPLPLLPEKAAHLAAALDAYPVRFRGNPLHLLFLDDATLIADPQRYLRGLDAPAAQPERREYLFVQRASWPFPTVTMTRRPDPWAVSLALFARFEAARALLPAQAAVGTILAERVRETRPDIVLLVVVDGLSYYDVRDLRTTRPCLVTGPTITRHGYRQVLGDGAVARRLFDLGYRDQVGLSYFNAEDNDLAAELFAPFGASQMYRMRDVEDGCAWLAARRLAHGYVQITVAGLDGLSHQHRDRPLRAEYLAEVFRRFETLTATLQVGGKRVLACLTADHGILWRDVFEAHPPTIVGDAPGDATHPRYLMGGVLRPYGRVAATADGTYTLLGVPHLTRALRSNEWGVHGGLSAWESLVPLVIVEE